MIEEVRLVMVLFRFYFIYSSSVLVVAQKILHPKKLYPMLLQLIASMLRRMVDGTTSDR